MQEQTYHTQNTGKKQGVNKLQVSGAGDRIGSLDRYLLQLYTMLRTARRMDNRRVIVALSGLIARRRGIA